jgi:hypothetical protein
MGFFDRFRRRRATPEQEARLARITNPQQRATLLKALADGDTIPEYAWEPLPTEFDTVAFLRRADKAAATRRVPVVEAAPSEASHPSADDVDREIVRCAEMLRPTATAATGYLSASIDCQALASARVFTPLLAWAFFNPFGPTLCALHLVEVPGTREYVIFLRSLNPFATSATAHGLLPAPVGQDTPQLVSILRRLFSGEETPMPNLPTHVRLLPESPLNASQAKTIILSSAKATDSQALAVTIQRLKTYKGDPWKRTAVERDEAFARIRPGGVDASAAAVGGGPATEAQFEQWWVLATDPDHVRSEVDQLPRAWDGAVEFQKRMKQR